MVRGDLNPRSAFRRSSQGNAAHRQIDDKALARLELHCLMRVVIGECGTRQSRIAAAATVANSARVLLCFMVILQGLVVIRVYARRDRSVPLRARLDEGGEMKVSEDHCGSPYTQTPPMRTRTRMSWLPLEFQKVSLCCRPALS